MNCMANILYLSLTGMTEPLGRSQVLEYLADLSKENKIYLLSFERVRDINTIAEIESLTKRYEIEWKYFIYTNRFGLLSTVSQIFKAVIFSSKWIKKERIHIIHARSMIPASMGLILKNIYGIKLLFDIRGFTIDEKVDTGRLNKKSMVYKILKKLNNYLYRHSDHIVTLTHKAKEILQEQFSFDDSRITVIPTCANKEVFKILSENEKQAFKLSLGYALSDKIIIHTGTVSGWYDFENEVKLMKEMMRKNDNIHFLVLNKNERSFIQKVFDRYEMPTERVKITSAPFDEVHKYLNIAEASLFFIKPSFSKQASAPTKFAENVACMLPSITNKGVGDMEYYLEHYDVGSVVEIKELNTEIEAVAAKILENQSRSFNEEEFKRLFEGHFDKKMAVRKYQIIYNQITVE